MSDDLARKIYRVFDPAPLRPGQQDLYVDLDAVRGHTNIVHRMSEKIRLNQGATCQVLTGHRGSGKSTELWRLRTELERHNDEEPSYFVVPVQADDELDRNDVDFPDVLIAIVRQLAHQLRERVKIELKPAHFADRFSSLKRLLGEAISFDATELNLGLTKLTASIKSSPEARDRIRKALEPDTDNWLAAANDVIGQSILGLEKKGYRGLVIIVDDLDKMIVRPHDSAGCTTSEYLFVHRSAQLTAFKCHLIYTLPLELAYSHHESKIKQLYGGHLPVVPMTKIFHKPPKSTPYKAGIERFRAVIDARLKEIGVGPNDLFESDRIRDDLIKLTGGQPTELMSMIREAIITDDLPIGRAGVNRCRIESMRSYRRMLRIDHWPVIEEVRRTGQVVRTSENETAFRELLDSRAILVYNNDDEWYGVNPALGGLENPASKSSEAES